MMNPSRAHCVAVSVKHKHRRMKSIKSSAHREVMEHLRLLKQTWQFSCDKVRNESLRSNSEQESIKIMKSDN